MIIEVDAVVTFTVNVDTISDSEFGHSAKVWNPLLTTREVLGMIGFTRAIKAINAIRTDDFLGVGADGYHIIGIKINLPMQSTTGSVRIKQM